MKSWVRRSALLSLALLTFGRVAEADDAYKAPADGKIDLQCECITAVSGFCNLKRFDDAAGKPRHSWVQSANLKKGTTYNLDKLCYGKRDVEGHGAGMCCTDRPRRTRPRGSSAVVPHSG